MNEPRSIAPLPREAPGDSRIGPMLGRPTDRLSRPRRSGVVRILTARLLLTACGLLIAACAGRAPEPTGTERAFPELIAALSEPGGFFDTDNLISNERSYLHVVSDLQDAGISGGAYVGVGPEQNFSYIAAVDPEIAFIVDVRRDNALEHLIFKALFEESLNRFDYVCLLFGRPVPDDLETRTGATVEDLIAFLDGTPSTRASRRTARARVDRAIQGFGLPLSDSDFATIARFHGEFIDAGLNLQFRSFGRAPRFYYPTYRDLLRETDRTGRQVNYLASETRFRKIQTLQREDRIIPIVGDLAGDHALRAIGEHLSRRRLSVSAFYTSNVEFYLFRSRSFARFLDNLRRLPIDDRSVIIRSVFHGLRGPHPRAVPGYYSTQLLQSARVLLQRVGDGTYRDYWDVVTRDVLASP